MGPAISSVEARGRLPEMDGFTVRLGSRYLGIEDYLLLLKFANDLNEPDPVCGFNFERQFRRKPSCSSKASTARFDIVE